MNANARLITAIFTKPLARVLGGMAGDKRRLHRAFGTNKLPQVHPPKAARKNDSEGQRAMRSKKEHRDGRGLDVCFGLLERDWRPSRAPASTGARRCEAPLLDLSLQRLFLSWVRKGRVRMDFY